MSDTGGDIIIKGGSVELTFNQDHYKKKDKKLKHETAEIEQIIIEGDENFGNYDSRKQSVKFTGTIKILCKE